MTGKGGPVFKSRRHLIEQAIARGESTDRICSALGVDLAVVDETRAAMDAAIAEPDDDEPVPTVRPQRRPGRRLAKPDKRPHDPRMTPGQAALAEAMRLEQARIYGQLQFEFRQPVEGAASPALVFELETERKRRRTA